jgi:uncharacterized membrane protein
MPETKEWGRRFGGSWPFILFLILILLVFGSVCGWW